MRVILEVTSGPTSGRKVVLGAFQNLQVGRTEWADFSVPQDGRMSSVHFQLETDNAACYVLDLQSRNGTFLNGRPLIERMPLRSGDILAAGETTFRISLEGETASPSLSPKESSPFSEPPSPPLPASPVRSTPVPSSVTVSESGESGVSETSGALGGKERLPTVENGPSRYEAGTSGASIPLATDSGATNRPETRSPPLKKHRAIAYTVESCPSGLSLCRGKVAEIRPTDLANLLSLKVPLHLIVDPKKHVPLAHDRLPGCEYLFDWIPPETACWVSPVVIAGNSKIDWPSFVEQGWGNDAVECLFSRYDSTRLLEHLRQCLRGKSKGDEAPSSIVGYCWPGVMSLLLSQGMSSFVQHFFTGIEAVMIELPDLPELWQLFGPPSIVALLDDLGFQRAETL